MMISVYPDIYENTSMMDRLSRGAKAGEACHGRMKQSLLMLYVGALTQRYQQMTRRK